LFRAFGRGGGFLSDFQGLATDFAVIGVFAGGNVKYILRNIILTLEIYYNGGIDMKQNKLGYLGLLGLTGLLGLANPALYSLFSFFTLFVFGINADERIQKNTGLASRNAFIYDTIIAIASIAYLSASNFEASPIFPVLLTQGITIFALSYWYYQEKGE
jgi:hypothetical protein